VGAYPGRGQQQVRISCTGSKLTATKVTGDRNVPAGEITFEVRLPRGECEPVVMGEPAGTNSHEALLDPYKVRARSVLLRKLFASGSAPEPLYRGLGHVAQDGFVKPVLTPGQFFVLSPHHVGFWFVLQRELVLFHRKEWAPVCAEEV